ncbi:FxsA family protein [Kumtagia ephedrae]|uniref:Membrane protein FxsA n=1 Tax=Kumtagia ephedrae TaxID=2116701 RepID=A0A2P7S1R5_9HYPH|nr:FxsA family protein [Mesorhizobium ephedrae]PSJ56376.1 membrane protein FxsA [Mesorhizobium ephedrae]
MRRILLPLFLLALPLIEIAGFVIVGSEIGVLATMALVLASCILGSILLRLQGFGVLSRIRQDVAEGRDPGRQLAHGVMILVAGILLIIPGFFTDIIGLLLFLPPVRDLGWRLVRDRVQVVGDFGTFRGRPHAGGGRGGGKGPTIDLDEDDYKRTPDPDSPWRRIDRG